jgi:hypothetical protein
MKEFYIVEFEKLSLKKIYGSSQDGTWLERYYEETIEGSFTSVERPGL